MGTNWLLFICALFWGISTFLNRLSVEKMSPVLFQVIVGVCYIMFIPFALKQSGALSSGFKWSATSIALTFAATALSITANILLYTNLKGNNQTGSSTMIVSLYPVITLILSAIFLHEHFNTAKIAGVIAMVVGAFLLGWK